MNSKAQFTTEHLAAARSHLNSLQEKWENYSGNNPDKYRASIADARVQVHLIEDQLKPSGALADSEQERVFKELGRLFPNAQTRQVVEHEGKKFKRRYFQSQRAFREKP